MRKKLTNWLVRNFLSILLLCISAQGIMLVVKILRFENIAWRYTLAPIFAFVAILFITLILVLEDER